MNLAYTNIHKGSYCENMIESKQNALVDLLASKFYRIYLIFGDILTPYCLMIT